MKNKFKALLAGFLGLCGIAAVSTTANATENTYGTATISKTTNDGDTKTWDFSTNHPTSSNLTLAAGDSDLGIIIGNGKYSSYTKDSKVVTTSTTIKKDGSGLSVYSSGYFYVPVPSADAAGTFYLSGSSNTGRYVNLYTNAGAIDSSLEQKDSSKVVLTSFPFDSDNVYTNPETYTGYYLKIEATNKQNSSGDTSSTTTGEYKFKTIKLLLTTGSFGTATVTHKVTYMDGSSTLNTIDVNDGDESTYTPKKYGYDFVKWVDENGDEITDLTITADTTLYATWSAWTDNKIGTTTLDSDAIAKIATGIEGTTSEDVELKPSIYTAMTKVAFTTTNCTLPGASAAEQNPCFNTSGALSTTSGGVKFTASANGTFVAYVGAGGGSARNAKFTDGTNELTPSEGATALSFDGSSYEPVKLTFTVTADTTYYLGGSNGVRIYYMSFVATEAPTVLMQEAKNASNEITAVRFIGIVRGVTELTATDVTLNLQLTNTSKSYDETVKVTPRLVSKIMNGEDAYTATVSGADYTFADHSCEYYVVYVLSVTGADLSGYTLTGTLKVGSFDAVSFSGYTFA